MEQRAVARHARGGRAVDVGFITEVCSEVLDELGVGHTERVYQRGIVSVLNNMEIFHRSEVTTPIYVRGECVGQGRADIVVGRMAVEIKAVVTPPFRASGQLCKYVRSLNADKIDQFHRSFVLSSFFPRSGGHAGAGTVTDLTYTAERQRVLDELYTGVVVNFNQKTEKVDIVYVQESCMPSDDRCAEEGPKEPCSPGQKGLRQRVKQFLRLCVETVDDPGECVPLYTLMKEFESFTSSPIRSVHEFKSILRETLRPCTRSARTLGRVCPSVYKTGDRIVYFPLQKGKGLSMTTLEAKAPDDGPAPRPGRSPTQGHV